MKPGAADAEVMEKKVTLEDNYTAANGRSRLG